MYRASSIILLFFALISIAGAQTKFFEVESGALYAPIKQIEAFVGNNNFSVLATYDHKRALPTLGPKTNKVYGREYAEYRLDYLLDRKFASNARNGSSLRDRCVESRVDMTPTTAGFWITIVPKGGVDGSIKPDGSGGYSGLLAGEIDNLKAKDREFELKDKELELKDKELEGRIRLLEEPRTPHTFWKIRGGLSGSYFGDKFKDSPFGLNIESSFDLTDISQFNFGGILFDPEEFFGGYSAYLQYGWRWLYAEAQYSVFKFYADPNNRDRRGYLGVGLGLQADAGAWHFTLGGQLLKSLITADVNNGIKVVSLQNERLGLKATITYEFARVVTATR
jgi:hypothetical protein